MCIHGMVSWTVVLVKLRVWSYANSAVFDQRHVAGWQAFPLNSTALKEWWTTNPTYGSLAVHLHCCSLVSYFRFSFANRSRLCFFSRNRCMCMWLPKPAVLCYFMLEGACLFSRQAFVENPNCSLHASVLDSNVGNLGIATRLHRSSLMWSSGFKLFTMLILYNVAATKKCAPLTKGVHS